MKAADLKPLGKVIQRIELKREKHTVSLREVLLPLEDIPADRVKLKPLTNSQKGVIALHLAGMSYTTIAKMTNYRPAVIAYIMNHPSAQELLAKGYEQIDREAKSLYGPAIETVRAGIQDDDLRIGLKASEIALKLLGKADPNLAKGDNATAEDVIQRILEIRSEGPVEIRLAEQRKEIT